MLTPTPATVAHFANTTGSDLSVGLMIEGNYCWREYCLEHGDSFLLIYPERKSRGISVFEVCSSWREMKCHACSKLLWSRGPVEPQAPAKKAQSTGHTVLFTGKSSHDEKKDA